MNAGRPLAFFWAVLLSECVLTAEGADPGHGFDLKYILIGGGIGLFLAAVFIATKVCMVRRQVLEMCSGCSRKTSKNHLQVLSHVSNSEHPMEMASNGSKG
ncbi:transmembrane protein 273-like [Oryzias latipes]